MEQSLYGIRGIVTDSITGDPLEARVEISGHDVDSSHVYSFLPVGNYHRYLYQGNYDLTFSKTGYHSKTISANVVNKSTVVQDVQLVPISFVDVNQINSIQAVFNAVPNPAKEQLQFNYQLIENTREHELVICDELGKIIDNIQLNESIGTIEISLKSFSAGVYYYSIKSGNSMTKAKKLIVVK